MDSIADSSIHIQTSPACAPCPPPWFGEVVLLSQYLRKLGILTRLAEDIHFTRRRFGRYEMIDFLVVLFGYAISGERTLQAFYEAVRPVAQPFMAHFGRERLPSPSAFSRFLAALPVPVVEALRVLFLADLVSRPLCPGEQEAGLLDRQGMQWTVFDVDGTREAARQRALPIGEGMPPAHRRLEEVCARGYTGRKRGEVEIKARTTVLQAHSHQWLGSFGNKGNR